MTGPDRKKVNRRPWILIVAIVGGAVVIGLAYLVYSHNSASARLQRAVEEADRDDPNWRLGEVVKRRATIPDEENPAFRVEAVALKSKGWTFGAVGPKKEGPPRGPDLIKLLDELGPAESLSPEMVAGVKAERAALKSAIDEARPLADMGEGRFPIVYDPIFTNTMLPYIGEARNVARLLRLDAIGRAEDGDIDGSLDSCRAILGVARAIGDEPFLVSQEVRIANDSSALATIERALAQGVASDAALVRVEEALEKEAKTRFLLNGLRGTRAGMHQTLEKLRQGEVSISQLAIGPTPAAMDVMFRFGSYGTYNHALTLELFNRALVIGRLPAIEQGPLWESWERELKPSGAVSSFMGMFAAMIVPTIRGCADSELRIHALLDTARLMIACERFRLAEGRWPDRIKDLSPRFVEEIPGDPYIGGSVKLIRLQDSLVVYVAGPDRSDDGGRLDFKHQAEPGKDLGYRLWNPEHRRVSPPELPDDVFQSNQPFGVEILLREDEAKRRLDIEERRRRHPELPADLFQHDQP